jgi:hypothetical protein
MPFKNDVVSLVKLQNRRFHKQENTLIGVKDSQEISYEDFHQMFLFCSLIIHWVVQNADFVISHLLFSKAAKKVVFNENQHI